MKKTNEPRTPTEAQINANRENAKKSTGPRTAAGKEASSRNRLLHGLRAHKHILLDEDPAEFLRRVQDNLDRFQPVGPTEEDIVLHIAADQWRFKRTLTIEEGLYRARFGDVAAKDKLSQEQFARQVQYAAEDGEPAPPPPAPPDPDDLIARAFNLDGGPNALARLSRYQAALQRSVERGLRQLKTYQAARPQPGPPSQQPLSPDPETAPQPAAKPAPSEPTPAATPSNDADCHSNPRFLGVGQATAAMLLLMLAFLRAVPQFFTRPGSRMAGPRTGHNRPKMNIFHPLAPAANRVRQAPGVSPLRRLYPEQLNAI